VQKLRLEFWEKVRDISVEDLIFIDESGVNLALVRLYARAIKGQRARGTKPHKKGKNISMIGAISVKGVVTSINILGGINKITFEAFVINKLVPKLWKGAVIIMDNCTSHKSKEIEQAIENAGAKLIFLSPYSPDFSPIENFWSKVKSILRFLKARTYKALEQAIIQAYDKVSQKDFYNWFTHCCYCISSI